jgi:hydrogenase maturation protease
VNAAVLVAGVGNVFRGDDGFGVEVARRLCAERLPPGVEVEDFGVRGLHLAYRLLDPVRLVLVVDLVSRGGPPGTLYVIEPLVDPGIEATPAEAHGLNLPGVLAAVAVLGGTLPPVRVVGCEPSELGERMGLSAPVGAAIGPAVRIVLEMVESALRNTSGGTLNWRPGF